ncbi:MAG TPA: ATP-dependent DNA helicase [Candidatus Dormibacteraeota bacterium]|nr:ATP-dependent DNA helicase [Candidatus Dormibacteraeota bacterium]
MESTLRSLNPEQRRAVEHLDGPLLVIAGAGTGKTEVITSRIAYLINHHHIPASQIIALTFTDKAAREMEERVDTLLPLGLNLPQVQTFNSFGDQLLREYALDMGLPISAKLMSKTQQLLLLIEHFDDLELEYFAPRGNPSDLFINLLGYFSTLRNELIQPEDYGKYAAKSAESAAGEEEKLEADKHLELSNLYKKYTQIKKKKGLMDYDDQINLVIELMDKRPNISKEIRERYRYILVDEFQDTNYAQNYLLELVAGKKGNLMVVGDDDQSIYKFRGAAVSNILRFSETFQDVERIVLTRNYRSTQKILDASYRLIQHNNPDRLEFKYQINKVLAASETGTEPTLLPQPDYHAETEAVAALLAKRIASGTKPADIAVLARKHKQLEALVPSLQRHKVPFSLLGPQKLYKQPEVELVVHALRYLSDPHNSEALYHLLAREPFKLDIHQLAAAAGGAKRMNMPLRQYLQEHHTGSKDFNASLTKFLAFFDALRDSAANRSVLEVAYSFLTESGYIRQLETRADQDPTIPARFKNLERFLQLLTDFSSIAHDASLQAFASQFDHFRDFTSEEAFQEADYALDEVRLLTIHQSKGLEFETVVLFDFNQTDFPGSSRTESLKIPDTLLAGEVLPAGNWHLQEERRLAYVAMTRAKKELVMTFSPNHGSKRLRRPSIFLQEALGDKVEIPEAETATFTLDRFASVADNKKLVQSRLYDNKGRLRLTPYQIDDYLTCPYNFRYRVLLQVPQGPNPVLMYGNIIHQAINQYYVMKRQGKIDEAVLLKMIEDLWVSQGFTTKQQEDKMIKQAQSTVKKFIVQGSKSDLMPVHSEHPFQFELPSHKLVVSGRFDAVFQYPDGQVEIRDYKTGQTDDEAKAEDRAKKSIQLGIYALAWEKITGKAPDIVALEFVDTGTRGTTHKTAKQLMAIEEKIIAVSEGIRAGRFEPKGDHRYCEHGPVQTGMLL